MERVPRGRPLQIELQGNLMGQLFGSLAVSEYLERGNAPPPTDGTCLVTLHQEKAGTSAWLGACAQSSVYEVDYDALSLGYFKGCPGDIKLTAQPGGGGSSPTPTPSSALPPGSHLPARDSVDGSCHRVPLGLSNNALRFLVTALIVVIVGGVFAGGMMVLYRHNDSTNTPIFAQS